MTTASTGAVRVARHGAALVPGGAFRMGSAHFYPEEGPVECGRTTDPPGERACE
jgi:hypothetical protein